MEFDRRSFLISAIAVITAGTTMSISKAALADPVVGRYAMVVKMQSLVFKTNDMFQSRMNTVGIKSIWAIDSSTDLRVYELDQQLNNSVDVLLGYMLKNFTPTYDDTTVALIDDLFKKRLIIDTMDINDLVQHVDAVVVVAVVRNLFKTTPVSDLRLTPYVWFNFRKVPNWAEYTRQYLKLI